MMTDEAAGFHFHMSHLFNQQVLKPQLLRPLLSCSSTLVVYTVSQASAYQDLCGMWELANQVFVCEHMG